MRMMSTVVAGAAATLALAMAGAVPAPPSASAAPVAGATGSPACPASLRSVPGGARDASTRGFDDGAAGTGQAYRPGQVLLRLDPGTSQRAFDCVLREIGAVKIAGGRGRSGFAGMSNLMLVQIPPNRSVVATTRLLGAPRYRALVDAAQPNDITVTAEAPCPDRNANPAPPARFPDDPLFPFQWGLDKGNEAARTNSTFAQAVTCDDVVKWPGLVENGQTLKAGDAVETMRIPEAWPLLKRWYWFNRSVKIGIVDDSLVQHPDLEGSVPRDAGRVVRPAALTRQLVKITATQGTFRVRQGAGDESCDIPFDASAEDIRMALEKRVAVMCDVTAAEAPAPRFILLVLRGGGGRLGLTIGASTVDLAANVIAGDATGAAFQAAIAAANPALKAEIDNGNLQVRRLGDPPQCAGDADQCSNWMIALRRGLADPQTAVTVDVSRLVRRWGIVVDQGEATLARSRYEVIPGLGPREFAAKPLNLPQSLADQSRWTFSPAGAAEITKVRGDGYAATAPANRTWPGQQEGDPNARHGQLIAGIIGARANNGIGMAGVLGPYVTPKLFGVVTPLDSAAELVAIEYLAGQARVPVINWSRGGHVEPGKAAFEAEAADPQAEDPRPADLTQQQMAQYPGTLFVVAAGNAATNLNHSGPRARDMLPGVTGTDYDPCGPKGMGITDPPGRGRDGRQGQEKGGALSMLRMPDGTFDRGNIICVAALSPAMQTTASTLYKSDERRSLVLAPFSSWGAGIVDVAAPGAGVIATGLNNGYATVDGTSFATPLVAGVAGLINAKYPGIDPSLVKCAILSSATQARLSINDFRGGEWPFRGYGLGPEMKWKEETVLTVPGMVVATEALSAAAHLKNKTSGRRNVRRVAEGDGPTCVQKRDYPPDDAPPIWADTDTRPVPKPPDPPAPPAPTGP